MTQAKLLIAIPAYNEALSIKCVVQECKKYGDVLVVNDGSDDQTASVSENAGAMLINKDKNEGYEQALYSGYMFALENKYDTYLTIDADGQLPVSRIPDFCQAITSGSILVVGRRSKIPRISERLLSCFTTSVLGIQDPYCGMKAYNLKKIPDRLKFSYYNSIGTSMLLSVAFLGMPVSSINIDVVARDGTSRFGGVISSELRLLPSTFIGIARIVRMQLFNTFSIFTKSTMTKND